MSAAEFRPRLTKPSKQPPDTTGMSQLDAQRAYRACGWIWVDCGVSVPMTEDEFAQIPEANRAYLGQYDSIKVRARY